MIDDFENSLELADRTFRNKEFYQTFQDAITPAGLAFFQCDWDHSLTEFFHNTLSMTFVFFRLYVNLHNPFLKRHAGTYL